MLIKFTSLLLITLFFGGSAKIAYANDTKEKISTAFAAKVKANVGKLGIGEAARVKVKLHENTKLKGFVLEAGENSFVVVNEKTGEPTTVEYSAVKQIKGNNLNSGVKFAIIIAVAVAAMLIFIAVGFSGGTDR